MPHNFTHIIHCAAQLSLVLDIKKKDLIVNIIYSVVVDKSHMLYKYVLRIIFILFFVVTLFSL